MAEDPRNTQRRHSIALGTVGCVLLALGLVFGPDGGLPRYALPICLGLGAVLVVIAIVAPARWIRRLAGLLLGPWP